MKNSLFFMSLLVLAILSSSNRCSVYEDYSACEIKVLNHSEETIFAMSAEHVGYSVRDNCIYDDTVVVRQLFRPSIMPGNRQSNQDFFTFDCYPLNWETYFSNKGVDTIYVLLAKSDKNLVKWITERNDTLLCSKYALTLDDLGKKNWRKEIEYTGTDSNSKKTGKHINNR